MGMCWLEVKVVYMVVVMSVVMCVCVVCGGVVDVCVVIKGVMGFCGDDVSMSRLRCGFCLCGSGCVVFCGV